MSQPEGQPAEDLIQRAESPYLRAGQEILAEIGERATLFVKQNEAGPATEFSRKSLLEGVAKARAFATEKSRHLQQGWDRLRDSRLARMGVQALAGAASINFIAPAASPLTEKAGITQKYTQTAPAKAEGVDQGTGGYPWAGAAEGTVDDYQLPAGECESFVHWKLLQQGVDPDRASAAVSPEQAKSQFERVDDLPATGAIATYTKPEGGGHIMYIKAFDGKYITYEDFNGKGGARHYWTETVTIEEFKAQRPGIQFIHLELPPVANGAFIATAYDEEKKNTLSQSNNNLFTSNYLRSPNGRHVAVFNKGNFAKYDTEKNFEQTWQSNTTGKNGERLEIEIRDKKQSNRLIMRDEDGRIVWSLNLGIGVNKFTLNDDGTFTLYKGNKRLATSISLTEATKTVQAADRKRALSVKRKALAAARARKARNAKQAKATTRTKAINKKASERKGTVHRSK